MANSLPERSILLSHSGKQHAYHVAKAMHELGVLGKFYTSSYVSNVKIQELSERFGLSFLSRRYEKGIASPMVSSNWRFEFPEILVRTLVGNSTTVNRLIYRRDELFDRFVSKSLRKSGMNYFWGFQGSCLYSLREAKALGMKAVCEMTLSHVPFANRLLREEQQINPDWADSVDFTAFPSWYEKRMLDEPFEASHIVAISAFLKRTLLSDGIPEKKISVIPLGFDISKMVYKPEVIPLENRALRVLYAGRITQRKGISYLLDAMGRFSDKDVELHIIGDVFGSGKAFRRYNGVYHHRPAMSQTQLFREYCQYDILVFPSLLEGFGLVNLEAMGAGLPVITTPNTNAAEVLADGINGFIVPIRDSNAIAAAIERIRNMDTGAFQRMRILARQTAEKYTWEKYREILQEKLQYGEIG
jgi:starch synthase